MKLCIKELNTAKCVKYIREDIPGEMLLSSLIKDKLSHEKGKYYTIVPENTNETDLYSFEIGGKVYPFMRIEDMNERKVVNKSEDVLLATLVKYVQGDQDLFFGIEDYSADTGFPYFVNSNRKYHLINDRIYYLIDKTHSSEEILRHIKWASGYGFLCATLEFKHGLNLLVKAMIDEVTNKEITPSLIEIVNSFFVEIYDGEGYLIWLKGGEHNDLFHFFNSQLQTPIGSDARTSRET